MGGSGYVLVMRLNEKNHGGAERVLRRVEPSPPLRGRLAVPGDKSISQRVALLAAIAEGVSEVRGFLEGEDAYSTLGAMCALGARAERDGDTLRITGTGGRLTQPVEALDLGNSGTGTRLLAGLLAGHPLAVELRGDASLSRRPMGRIRDPLEQMGARIELTGERGTLPMTIRGGALQGIHYPLPVASAQVKSSVLLAGLTARGKTVVIEPRPTRDHTEKLFELFGIPLEIDGLEIRLDGFGPEGPRIAGRTVTVPGDFSSAAFWIAAAAARPGAEVTIDGVGLNPRRTALLDVLRRMGACIEVRITDPEGDPSGTIRVEGRCLRGTEVGGDEIPNLIDELPVLAAIASQVEGATVIRDAKELRVKESDRIAVMVGHLRSMGVDASERPDGMIVRGPATLRNPGDALASHGDHRIAMSMAVLATFAPGPVELADTACIETSYPGFSEHLQVLGGRCDR